MLVKVNEGYDVKLICGCNWGFGTALPLIPWDQTVLWVLRLHGLVGAPAGTPGTPGTPGTAGTAGTAGTPGTPGTPGTLGTAGTGGTAGENSNKCNKCDFASSYVSALRTHLECTVEKSQTNATDVTMPALIQALSVDI